MTGLERNSDVVIMASYAPLLVNLNHRAWNPDLINFDSSKWYGLPSYYVQQMFSENRGDVVLPVEVESPMAKVERQTRRDDRRRAPGTRKRNSRTSESLRRTGRCCSRLIFPRMQTAGRSWATADWSGAKTARCGRAPKGNSSAPWPASESWTDYTLTLKARKISRHGRLPDFVPHRRRRRPHLVEHWRLGQHAGRH